MSNVMYCISDLLYVMIFIYNQILYCMVDINKYRRDCDFLNFKDDKTIRKFLRDEILLFSSQVIKINRYGIEQKRDMVITNKAIYNISAKALKRRIDIKTAVKGITCSSLSDELVIHCLDLDYDYHYKSNLLKLIIENIVSVYQDTNKIQLPVCVLEEKSLGAVVTNKKEKQKDINFSRMSMLNLVNIREFLYGEVNFNLDLPDVDFHCKQKRKDLEGLQLKDLKLIRLIGKGKFSEVFITEFKGEVFALKTMRKDVILLEEKLNHILLEKRILQRVSHCGLISAMYCFQTDERINFLMPFIQGGDLYDLLKIKKVFSENE